MDVYSNHSARTCKFYNGVKISGHPSLPTHQIYRLKWMRHSRKFGRQTEKLPVLELQQSRLLARHQSQSSGRTNSMILSTSTRNQMQNANTSGNELTDLLKRMVQDDLKRTQNCLDAAENHHQKTMKERDRCRCSTRSSAWPGKTSPLLKQMINITQRRRNIHGRPPCGDSWPCSCFRRPRTKECRRRSA